MMAETLNEFVLRPFWQQIVCFITVFILLFVAFFFFFLKGISDEKQVINDQIILLSPKVAQIQRQLLPSKQYDALNAQVSQFKTQQKPQNASALVSKKTLLAWLSPYFMEISSVKKNAPENDNDAMWQVEMRGDFAQFLRFFTDAIEQAHGLHFSDLYLEKDNDKLRIKMVFSILKSE